MAFTQTRPPEPVPDCLDLSGNLWHHEHVPVDESRQRLARLMDERRRILRSTWDQVAERGSITYETIRQVRGGGAAQIRPLTKRGIEIGLAWPPGTVDEILTGRAGEEVVTDSIPAPETEPRQRALARDDALIDSIWRMDLPDRDKIDLVQIVLDERAEADRRAARRVRDHLRWADERAN